MDLTSYSGLQAAIAGYLNRSDLATEIRTFIALAEARIRVDIGSRHWRAQRRQVTTATERYVTLPSSWLEAIYIEVQDAPAGPVNLKFRSPQQLNGIRRQKDNTTGCPEAYTLVAGEIELAPDPDRQYTLEMAYCEDVALSDTATSNWCLEYAPNVYLYAAMLESALFLKDWEQAPLWEAKYAEAAAKALAQGRRAQYSGEPIESRPPTRRSIP